MNEIIDLVDEKEKRDFIVSKTSSLMVHVGPLPPASELQAYKNIMIDAPEKIFAMAEKSQEHKMEKFRCYHQYKTRGQLFAFLIVMGSFALTGVLAYIGQPLIGGIISFASIASVALALIYGERKNSSTLKKEQTSVEKNIEKNI